MPRALCTRAGTLVLGLFVVTLLIIQIQWCEFVDNCENQPLEGPAHPKADFTQQPLDELGSARSSSQDTIIESEAEPGNAPSDADSVIESEPESQPGIVANEDPINDDEGSLNGEEERIATEDPNGSSVNADEGPVSADEGRDGLNSGDGGPDGGSANTDKGPIGAEEGPAGDPLNSDEGFSNADGDTDANTDEGPINEASPNGDLLNSDKGLNSADAGTDGGSANTDEGSINDPINADEDRIEPENNEGSINGEDRIVADADVDEGPVNADDGSPNADNGPINADEDAEGPRGDSMNTDESSKNTEKGSKNNDEGPLNADDSIHGGLLSGDESSIRGSPVDVDEGSIREDPADADVGSSQPNDDSIHGDEYGTFKNDPYNVNTLLPTDTRTSNDDVTPTKHTPKNPPYTIVSGASANHFCPLNAWVYNLHDSIGKTAFPGDRPRIIVYDLGLLQFQRKILHNLKNAGYIDEIRMFKFEVYPSHVDIEIKAGEYAWKPILISEVARDYPGIILWTDSGSIALPEGLLNAEKVLKRGGGFAAASSSGTFLEWTHPGVFEFYGDGDPERFADIQNCNAADLLFDTRKVPHILYEWLRCALHKECIGPEGSSRDNHRQDQAVLTYILANYSFYCSFQDEDLGITHHHEGDCDSVILDWQRSHGPIFTPTPDDTKEIKAYKHNRKYKSVRWSWMDLWIPGI